MLIYILVDVLVRLLWIGCTRYCDSFDGIVAKQGRRKQRRPATAANTCMKSNVRNMFDRFPYPSLRRIKEKISRLGKVLR